MKKNVFSFVVTLLISLSGVYAQRLPESPAVEMQEEKPVKVRLTLQYFHVMEGDSYLDIRARVRAKRGYTNVENLQLNVYKLVNEEPVLMGTLTTGAAGQGTFIIPAEYLSSTEPTGVNTYIVRVESIPGYLDSEKLISVGDASIEAHIFQKDSLNFLEARILDTRHSTPLSGLPLKVQIVRWLAPLSSGKDFYMTDENGRIVVQLDNDIPGDENNMVKFQVMLDDNDDYGNVVKELAAPIGIWVAREDTFDQRTLWGKRDKVPLWLLIIPNIFYVFVWVIIFILIYQLRVIYKS